MDIAETDRVITRPSARTEQSSSTERRAVIVLGMHRSGTSAVARSVSFCGYELPADVMPARSDNPKGFWEPLAVARLNDAILVDLGMSWDQPGSPVCPGMTQQETRHAVSDYVVEKWSAQAAHALQHSFGSAASIVLKDPRLALLLPLWEGTLSQAGYSGCYVLVYRNPLEVAASLNNRNAIQFRRAMQLWVHYNLACLAHLASETTAGVLSFRKLLASPSDSVANALSTDLSGEVRDRISKYITKSDNHFPRPIVQLDRARHIPGIVKNLWNLLEAWNGLPADLRARRLTEISTSYDEAMLFAGPILRPRMPPTAAKKVGTGTRDAKEQIPAPVILSKTPAAKIIHYHLFKNAGSSVDEMLKQNFGSRWIEQEFGGPHNRSNAAEVAEFLKGRPNIIALSSHTALLPAPRLTEEWVFPILFIRHPIIRIESAYVFERKQNADGFSTRLAKEHDFAGYVRGHLDHPHHRGTKNFQSYRLSFNEPDSSDSELVRAMRTIYSLPFVGLVETYAKSVKLLEQLMKPYLPEFRAIVVRKNATRSREASLEAELKRIRDELGTNLYDELVACNQDDLQLFSEVSRLYHHVSA